MSKYSIRRGISLGNRNIDDKETVTLEHVEYDVEDNQVKVDRALRSTLNSFLLDNQHRMSSGAENVFFTNLESDIDFYPAWGGLKKQEDVENQGVEGWLPLSGRAYGDLFTLKVYGEPALSGAIEYAKPAAVLGEHSVFGQEIILAQDVSEDDWLFYRVHYGQDDDGRLAYEQRLTGNNLTDGDLLRWWFTHPVEGHEGTPIFTTIKIAKGDEDAEESTLKVRPSLDGLNHYVNIFIRDFEDKELAFRESIGCSEFVTVKLISPVPNTLHLHNLEILSTDDCIPLIFNN